jgi:hypothetical protein
VNIQDVKSNLSAALHGGTLNKVRNIEMLLERSANILLSKIKPIETIRTASLSSTIHDDIYNYSLRDDFGEIIDLYPQSDRNIYDSASRGYAESFDLRKLLANKTVSIEGSEGAKIIRINWRSRKGKVLSTVNGVTGNGTWGAVGTATGIQTDTITKYSGSGSVRFDLAASGDGIQNSTLSPVDMTDEDEVADIFFAFYIKSAADLARLTSVTPRWGNDLTLNYWTAVALTAQADGTAFKVGWNVVKAPWSTATETGSVNPASIDAFRVIFTTTAAISDIRLDNIIFSIGRNFDYKYYSKYIVKNTSGTWISRTTSEDDIVVLDNDAIEIYHLLNLKLAAHQIEGGDSAFDINFSNSEIGDLIQEYNAKYPSQAKKAVTSYGSLPFNRFRRRFW